MAIFKSFKSGAQESRGNSPDEEKYAPDLRSEHKPSIDGPNNVLNTGDDEDDSSLAQDGEHGHPLKHDP